MKKVKIELPRKLRKILNTYITELDIPWRTLDALKDSGCLIIGDVVQKNEKELITDGLLNKKSVKELKRTLEELED
jgi:DNA-directed RNA polymerase alpha subunit